MPDNQFEKKAKQKLDELKFIPSDDVWLKVQARIKKDRDRRRMLIWVPVGALMLGAALWSLRPDGSTSVVRNGSPEKTITRAGEPESKPAASATIMPSDINAHANSLKEEPGNPAISLVANRAKKNSHGFPNSLQEDQDLAPETQAAQQSKEKKKDEPMLSSANGNAGSEKADADASLAEDATSKTEANASASQKNDSTLHDKVSMKESAGSKPAEKQEKKKQPKQKIQWGIGGGIGMSYVHSRSKSGTQPVYAPASGGTGYFAPAPSDEKPGLSFYLGLSLLKPLSKTTAVYSGLRYSYASSKISTGSPIFQPLTLYSSTASATYLSSYYPAAAGPTKTYTNQYHFLEIPLGIEQRFGGASRFSANAGFAIGWLIGSNGLQYDPQTKVYFKDNSYFHKVLFNIEGGVQYEILKKKSYGLKVGPRIQYGLSNLLNDKSAFTKHLLTGGIGFTLLRK
ncbi:MAG TPA: outer membrane beta-barrel protein [Puia sp.]|nr:outer membrane beta-barrel protein [Puia sp.]